jgi:predicted HTH domain antitoxin
VAAARITTIRIPAEDLDRLTEAAKRLKVERSSLIRRALDKGVREVLTDEAVLQYQRGEASFGGAAHQAGISLWEFLDELKARGVPFRTDEDLMREQLAEFREKLEKEHTHGRRRR